MPITDVAGAPESTVMDETYKVAITRLGDRIRVGGTAEITGYDLRLRESRRKNFGAFRHRFVPPLVVMSAKLNSDWPAPNDTGRYTSNRPHTIPQICSGTQVTVLWLDHGSVVRASSGRLTVSGKKPARFSTEGLRRTAAVNRPTGLIILIEPVPCVNILRRSGRYRPRKSSRIGGRVQMQAVK